MRTGISFSVPAGWDQNVLLGVLVFSFVCLKLWFGFGDVTGTGTWLLVLCTV